MGGVCHPQKNATLDHSTYKLHMLQADEDVGLVICRIDIDMFEIQEFFGGFFKARFRMGKCSNPTAVNIIELSVTTSQECKSLFAL